MSVSSHAEGLASEALERLKAGNARFTQGTATRNRSGERETIQERPVPYAILLTCPNLVTTPDDIFDAAEGQLFVLTTAGNVVDSAVLGSIEYAMTRFGCTLLVVMGHAGCKAVKGAIDGVPYSMNIQYLMDSIQPAAQIAKSKASDPSRIYDLAIAENVKLQISNVLGRSSVVREHQEKGVLRIAGAVYSLQSGRVYFVQ